MRFILAGFCDELVKMAAAMPPLTSGAFAQANRTRVGTAAPPAATGFHQAGPVYRPPTAVATPAPSAPKRVGAKPAASPGGRGLTMALAGRQGDVSATQNKSQLSAFEQTAKLNKIQADERAAEAAKNDREFTAQTMTYSGLP